MDRSRVPFLFLIFLLFACTLAENTLNRKCRDVLTCAIRQKCVKVQWLASRFEHARLTAQLYSDLDKGIDYTCIFTSGCSDECSRCPLCLSSKEQVVEVLSGNKLPASDTCSALVNCAGQCVDQKASSAKEIEHCLRHTCAFHCFDGSCPRCSAFITRVFNQVCVSADLKNKVGFKGPCPQMLREIVLDKFRPQFGRLGRGPSIGQQN